MKKRIVEFLLLSVLAVCHFVFWYAHYGYLNAAYSNAYFDTSFGLLSDALAYRGMMRYAENFLDEGPAAIITSDISCRIL